VIGHALGGRAGERLSGRLGLRISDDTLLRRVKQAAQARPPSKRIPALGVDDWAWRKGYGRYGTILVDLKRRKVYVQLRLACSVGDRPTGEKVRNPVAWIAERKETELL
jgi:hypothetical protein